MSIEKIDKTLMKEIVSEDITLFKEVIKELLIENQVIVSDEQAQRREKLEKIINEDFDKYDDVFKTLA